MKAFRIADGRHPLFDGTGAFLNGGRWNTRGHQVIYAASTYAGALLEQLVHANIGRMPKTQAWIEIDIPPEVSFEIVPLDELEQWDADHMVTSRARGDRWLRERKVAVLMVPSAVTAGLESNVLINPGHPDFALIRASEPRPVQWDPRLVRN